VSAPSKSAVSEQELSVSGVSLYDLEYVTPEDRIVPESLH
jgi:hypothetical protein